MSDDVSLSTKRPIKMWDKHIGDVYFSDGKKIFVMRRKKSKHFFRNFEGYGINKNLLQTLIQRFRVVEIRLVEILEDNCTNVYRTNPETFIKEGYAYKNKVEPFDEQYILPVKDFVLPHGRQLKLR